MKAAEGRWRGRGAEANRMTSYVRLNGSLEMHHAIRVTRHVTNGTKYY